MIDRVIHNTEKKNSFVNEEISSPEIVGKSAVIFERTLKLTGSTAEKDVTDFAIQYLHALGYNVTMPGAKWETPAEFNQRLRVCVHGIQRALKRPGCPSIATHRGPTGRIIKLCSNQDFDAFVLLHTATV